VPVEIERVRNVAVIAHVDHGKTTLVDQLLRQSGLSVDQERLLDKNDLERERGITILSKCTRLTWKDKILNIVDTPGHADFGGEVERILSMVDGVCLVVDIVEGPRTQTKFVLSKALLNPELKPIVVINKVDRPCERPPGEIENEIFDLFMSLEANDHQMEYPVLYASAKNGWVETEWDSIKNEEHPQGVLPLFEAIVSTVPPPLTNAEAQKLHNDPPRQLVSLIEQAEGFGPTATGKVYSGIFINAKNDLYYRTQEDKLSGKSKLRDLSIVRGTTREKTDVAGAGDIVSISVLGAVPKATDCISTQEQFDVIPARLIDPPVICVEVSPNTSPLAGQDGTFNTLQSIAQRLRKEALVNVAIDVAEVAGGVNLKGRGELQLGILLETMRREGFEMQVTQPTVVYQTDDEGRVFEPWEEFTIEAPLSTSAAIIEKMSQRMADLVDMRDVGDNSRIKFHCSSRNFLGVRTFLRDVTKGTAVVSSEFLEYRPKAPSIKLDRNGLILAAGSGTTTEFALVDLQTKGTLFVRDAVPIYMGQILGESNNPDDVVMNAIKEHPKYKGREKQKEIVAALTPPRDFTIEMALSYIQDDEMVEVTPKRIVMRKKILDAQQRKQLERKAAQGK